MMRKFKYDNKLKKKSGRSINPESSPANGIPYLIKIKRQKKLRSNMLLGLVYDNYNNIGLFTVYRPEEENNRTAPVNIF